jgi:hypothetical protein
MLQIGLGERLVYRGFLPCLSWNFLLSEASMLMPSSRKSSSVYLKYLAVGYLLFLKWLNSLPLIPTLRLLLPPMSIIRLSLLANSYAPHKSLGNFLIFSRLNLYHLLDTGTIILPLMIDHYLNIAYPLVKGLDGIANGGMGKTLNYGGS